MKKKYLFRVLISVLVLVFVGLIVLMRLPVVSMVAWEQHQLDVTDIERSTLVSGDIYIEAAQLPTLGPVQASWRWCPGWQPFSWCLQLQARDLEFDGRVSLGLSSARIKAAEIQLDSLAPAGIDPALGSLQALTYIDDLVVSNFACPMANLDSLAANAEISRIVLLGASMGNASLTASADQGLLDAVLTGDQISGSLETDNSRTYSGNLTIQAPPELESLFSQFAEPVAEGEYQWTISGRWPCNESLTPL